MICRTVWWTSALLVLTSCSNQHGSLITIKASTPITDSTGAPLAGNAAVDVELFVGTAPDGLAAAEGTSWIRDVSATTDQLANVTAAQLESGISVLLDPTSPHAIDGVQLAVAAWPHDGPAPTAASALWFGHVLLNLDPSLTLGYTVTLANTPTSLANTAPSDCPQDSATTVGPSVYLWSGDSDTTNSCIRWVDADGAIQQQIVREHDRDCDGLVPSPLPLASCQYTDLAQCDPSVSDGTTVGWVDADNDGYAENTIGTTHGVVMSTCQACTGLDDQPIECDCLLTSDDFSPSLVASNPAFVQQLITQMNPLIHAGAPEVFDGFDDNCDGLPADPVRLPGVIVTSGFNAPVCTTSAVAYPREEIEDISSSAHTIAVVAETTHPIADAASNVCLDFQCETPLLEHVVGEVPCAISLEAPQDVSANVLPSIPVCTARYNSSITGLHLCQSDGSATYQISLTKLIAPVAQLTNYNAASCEAQLWGTVPAGWDVELSDSTFPNVAGSRDVSVVNCGNVILRITPSITIDTDTVTTANPPVVVALVRMGDDTELANLLSPIALNSQTASCDNFSPCAAPVSASNGDGGGGGAGGGI